MKAARNAIKGRSARRRQANCEPLERRMLLTVVLSKGANGLVTVTESATGVQNDLTVADNAPASNATFVTISDSADTLITVNGLGAEGWTVAADGHSATGPTSTVSNLAIDTKDATDTVTILSCIFPVRVQPSDASDEDVVIGNGTTDDVTGVVTFDATHASHAVLQIEDGQETTRADSTYTSTQILGATPQPINFLPSQVASPDIFFINTIMGPGGNAPVVQQNPQNPASIQYAFLDNGHNTIGVGQLNQLSSVGTYAYAGAVDSVYIGSLHSIDGVLGSVDVDGGVGSANITVDDSADATPQQFSIARDGQSGVSVDENDHDFLNITTANVSGLTIDTGTESNSITADLNHGFPAGFISNFDYGEGGGQASITGLEATSTLNLMGCDNVSVTQPSVLGTINVSAPTTTGGRLIVDASTVTADNTINISSSAVTGLGGPINLTDVSDISVTGGTGFDDFTVALSPNTLISVDGGPLGATAPADRLVVTSTQTPTLQLTADSTGDHGSYFLPPAPGAITTSEVIFQDFGTISPVFGTVAGTVFNQQTSAPAGGVTLVLNVNGDGIDGANPTATTDANGMFSFTNLAAGTYPLLANSDTFDLAAPTSVTVSASTLGAPLTVPVVPRRADSGPDLVVSSVVASVAKGASNRPKVQVKITNLGAAMATTANVQVELLASTDQAISLDDTKLITSAVALRLNARASKTLTLTGTAASSLVAGQYFVLASVDSANAVAETNESNNVAASTHPSALAPASIDLTGKFGAVARSASKAKGLSAAFTLENLGNIAAGGSTAINFYGSTDRTLDDSDVAVGVVPVGLHLAPGKSQSLKPKLVLASLPAGSYYLIARINPTQSIGESSYTNNEIFSATPIAIA